jgi:hypothetical protein
MTKEDIIELASICGIRYFNTPVGTSEMHCHEHNLISFAEKLMNTRHVTPLQAAKDVFIEAFRNWYLSEVHDLNTFLELEYTMEAAWSHLQQTEEQSNGKA